MTAQQAYESGAARFGQYIVCDPIGRVVRIVDAIFSGCGDIYRVTSSGLVRVYF